MRQIRENDGMKNSSNQRYPFDQASPAQKKAGLSGSRSQKAYKRRGNKRAGLRLPGLATGLVMALLLIAGIYVLFSGSWLKLINALIPGETALTPGQTGLTPTAADTLSPAPTLTPAASPTPTPEPEIRITLACVGDIILHQSVIDGGLTADGTYNYDPVFQYVKPILGEADLALANYEGTLAGSPYSGYPFFCAPDAIADALAASGFQAVWTANNHSIDKGLKGLIRTAEVFRDKGFLVIGTRPDETGRTDAVADVRGIKIGLMAYTFETIGTPDQKTLNGINLPDGADPLIDSFNPYRDDAMARDLAALLDRAAALRKEGAEIICLSLHWGDEYKTRSNAYQRQMAQQLADAGIELIVGHHPHVLEEIDVLTSATTGKQTLVFYSISNFLHNMDFDTHGTSGKAQDAVIARIYLLKDSSGVRVEKAEYIPTYVVRVPKGNGKQHLIVPVLAALDDPASFQTTTQEMTASLERITAILGDSLGTAELPVTQAAR
ncbi:MAG TPA: hypothetical protein DD640_10830 [Clostridiales bacterium]|nr:hypothetical protein [Clostridiales bacterium]